MKSQADIRAIIATLKTLYPDSICSLQYEKDYELLFATRLSAQCTDQRVNLVTKDLFKKYRSAADYAATATEVLENDIKSTGFYRNKARNIRECCCQIVKQHGAISLLEI